MSVRQAAKNWLARHPLADGLLRRELWSRIHFPEMEMAALNRLAPHSLDIAVDVGAALGAYAWILNRKAREVVCFEPGTAHARYLRRLVGGTRIRLETMAVGDTCGMVELHVPGTDNHARHSATVSRDNPVAHTPGGLVERIAQTTLDAHFESLAPDRRIDLLKVDVEGHETAVMAGGLAMIARHHPLIICEIEARHNPHHGEVFMRLADLGYRAFFHQGGYRPLEGSDITPLQPAAALAQRLSGRYDPANNAYVNNFVFQHPATRIRIA